MQPLQQKTIIRVKSISDNRSFTIQTIQCLKENAEYENGITQKNDHFQIIWINKGKGNFWIDLRKYDFLNNSIYFIKPGQVFSFQAQEQQEGYIISFTDTFLGMENEEADPTFYSSLFQLFTHANGITIAHDKEAEIKDIADRMFKEYNNLQLFRNEMLSRYLRILFIYLARQTNTNWQTIRQTRNIELVQKFITFVDKCFKKEKMVSGYAAMLLVTPNYLNEIVKKTTGYSAGYHIRQRIVLEAKRHATYSNTCMKQIGYYLGFNDTAHFSKYFKGATGKNFSDFKKEKMVVSKAAFDL